MFFSFSTNRQSILVFCFGYRDNNLPSINHSSKTDSSCPHDYTDDIVDIEKKNRYTGRQGINEVVPRDKEAKQGIKNNTESQIRDKVTKRQ